MTMVEIIIDGVTKRYGRVAALEDVSVAVRSGSIHALVGPNGSGKTTLIRLLAGIDRPTSGCIEHDSVAVGVSFQHPRVFPSLTVDENLDVFASMADHRPTPAWIDEVCDSIRLTPVRHRRAGDLSGGFAKKLDIALAVLKRPDLLLMDEPLADVDAQSRTDISSFIGDFRRDNRTIIISTHAYEMFEPILDRVTLLVDGRVRADGTPEDLER